MKRTLLLIIISAISSCVFSQNEHIHIFQNNDFNTLRASEIDQMTYSGAYGVFTHISFTDTSGQLTKIALTNIDSVVLRMTAIPEFHINLQDHPEWNDLQGAKTDIHPATLYMTGNGMYSDLTEQTVEFRGRGNSTWNMRKKPYRFKMNKKASVCGLAKAKSYALIANNIDCTLMRNAIALWVANYFGMPYSNHCIPVKVYFNGINKGQYMLTEKIGIGSGSVDIDETKGMLFELDSNYDEDFKFMYTWRSGMVNKQLPVMVKDPDLNELAADPDVTDITNANAYFNLWKADFTRMADAVTQRPSSQTLTDVIDIESMVNFFFVNCLANNHEMQHPKSFYLYKNSLETDEVYHFGPVWDFDWAFTFAGREGAPADMCMVEKDDRKDGYTFVKALCSNEEFRAKFQEKLEDFYINGYPQLKAYIKEYALLIEPSAKENGLLWPSYTHAGAYPIVSSWQFRQNLNTLVKWIDDRLNFMRTNVNFGLYK